jgi:hypothetical protein
MESGGSSDRGSKDAAQIEQRNGFAKRKDDKPWSVASSVDSASALEDFRGTRINIRSTIEDGAVLLDGRIARVRQVMIPSGSGGSETSELIPARGMRTDRKVDARKRRVCRQRDGLRRNAAERSDPWWLRKFAHEG